MERYVEELKKILKGKRNVNKKVFKLAGMLYRATIAGRVTYERVLEIGGVSND